MDEHGAATTKLPPGESAPSSSSSEAKPPQGGEAGEGRAVHFPDEEAPQPKIRKPKVFKVFMVGTVCKLASSTLRLESRPGFKL